MNFFALSPVLSHVGVMWWPVLGGLIITDAVAGGRRRSIVVTKRVVLWRAFVVGRAQSRGRSPIRRRKPSRESRR